MNDTEVLNLLITNKEKINSHYNQIINKNSELKQYLENRFTDSESLNETIYRIWKQIYNRPICPVCGKSVKFIPGNGFRETCSVSCSKKLIKQSDRIVTDDIIKSDYLKDGKLNTKNKLQTKYLKDHNYYNYLSNRYFDCDNLSESIYRICYNIENKPICSCGKPVQFLGIEIGYDKYCSHKCKELDKLPDITDSYIKYFGIKSKLTNPSWYGYKKVEQYLKNKFKDEYRDYHEAIYMVINDIEHIPCCPICHKRIKFNPNYYNNIKYTKYCSDKCAILDKKYKHANKISQLLNTDISISEDMKYYIFHNYCNKHKDFKLTGLQIHNRTTGNRYKHTNLCPICNPKNNIETSIELVIKNILNELNIKFEEHDRNIISPKELDFYLPEYSIGIECNGIFWHSDFKKDNLYHYNKMKLCNKNNIQLLSFWETDIINNRDKIKDIIASKCNKNKKIYARLCTVKEITSKESKQFIDKYHLQRNINAKIKLGLFYNDKLVQVMTFGKKRVFMNSKGSDYDYELYRLCSKFGYTIIGGASKLLTYFKNNYKYNSIVSYCMSDISNGHIYEQLGFSLVKENKINYFYYDISHQKILNRYALAKYKINDNSGRSGDEIIKDMNIFKCYTSGTKTYILKNI